MAPHEIIEGPQMVVGGNGNYRTVITIYQVKQELGDGTISTPSQPDPGCPYPYPECSSGTCYCKACVAKKGLFRIVRGCHCSVCRVQFVKEAQTFGELAIKHFIEDHPEINVCHFDLP